MCAVQRHLTDPVHERRCLTLKLLWRLFHLFYHLPHCRSYEKLGFGLKGGIQHFEEYLRLACPPQGMSVRHARSAMKITRLILAWSDDGLVYVTQNSISPCLTYC